MEETTEQKINKKAELREWSGTTPADLYCYASILCVVAGYAVNEVYLKVPIYVSAMVCGVISIHKGSAPSEDLSGVTNFFKKYSYHATLAVTSFFIFRDLIGIL